MTDAAELPPGYELEGFEPSLFALRGVDDRQAPPALLHIFWYLASVGRYRIFYVRKCGAIVHVSYLLSWNPKFAFMDRGDLQIGPCRTDPAHRGQGLFPATLTHIAALYPGRRIWMFADEANEGSKQGIGKAGFAWVGWGERRRGIYRLEAAGREDHQGR